MNPYNECLQILVKEHTLIGKGFDLDKIKSACAELLDKKEEKADNKKLESNKIENAKAERKKVESRRMENAKTESAKTKSKKMENNKK